jgi:TolA-binding protein
MHKFLVVLTLLTGLMSSYAQAAMVPTQQLITHSQESFSQQELQAALASGELEEQLTELGVDTDQLADRLASLTPAEIVQLNAELESQPAGGIVGVLLTIFIVFVITDMLCATDIFSFVRCINK